MPTTNSYTPFGKLQALPANASPIIGGKWDHQDDAFYAVTKGIRDAVEALAIKYPAPQVHSPDQAGEDVADTSFPQNSRAEEVRVHQAQEEKRRLSEEAARTRRTEEERQRKEMQAYQGEMEQARQAEKERRHPQEVAVAAIPMGSPDTSRKESLSPEQIQFTAFYPTVVPVKTWATLLIYISLASALSNVQNDASLFKNELGPLPRTSQALSQYLLIRGTNLTIVPECRGVIFNPPSISFQWFEEWHRAAFRFQADMGLVGLASSGEISIYAGPLLIGMLKISLFFNDQGLPPAGAIVEEHSEVTGGIYHQMFVSYSHKDTDVVKICRNIYRALGLTVLIDTDNLRSGQIWSNALERMIDTD